MKYILLLIGLFLIIVGASECQPAKPKAQLTPADQIFYSQERDTPMVAALRVVPGSDWTEETKDSLETYGAMFISQNGTNSRESRFTLATLLDYMQDSIQGSPQTLTYTDDSLTISGSNTIVITGFADSTITTDTLAAHLSQIDGLKTYRLYAINNLSEIYGSTYATNSIFTRRSTGARYLVQSDSVAGYTVDSVAVIPTGSNYAVLQSESGNYDVKWFGAIGDSTTDDRAALQKAVDFPNAKTITFSKGTYTVASSTTAIDVPLVGISINGMTNKRFVFDNGAKIRISDDMNYDTNLQWLFFICGNSSDLVFDGINIDGNIDNTSGAADGDHINALKIDARPGNSVENITFLNTKIANSGSMILSGKNIKVDNFTFIRGSKGLAISPLASDSLTTYNLSNIHIDFTDSDFIDYTDLGNHAGISISSSSGTLEYNVNMNNVSLINVPGNKTQTYANVKINNMYMRGPDTCQVAAWKFADAKSIQLNNFEIQNYMGENTALLFQDVDLIQANNIILDSCSSSSSAATMNFSGGVEQADFNSVYLLNGTNTGRGILVASNVNIKNLYIDGYSSTYPVFLNSGSVSTLENVRIVNNTYTYAIFAQTNSRSSITNLRASNSRGMIIGDGADIKVYDTDFSSQSQGIVSSGSGVKYVSLINCDSVSFGANTGIVGLGTQRTNGRVKTIYSSARPTAGYWDAGDLVYNNTAPDDTIGWYCSVAGEPGTWTAFGYAGASSSNWTVTGSDLYRDSYVSIGEAIAPRSELNILSDEGASPNPTITIESRDVAVAQGDGMGRIDWFHNDASLTAGVISRIETEAAISYSAAAHGDLVFYTNQGAAGNLGEALRLKYDKEVQVPGYVSVTDSVLINGMMIYSGDAAPTAGMGTQGSLYMRNDNDSTLYTKTSGGWTLLN